MSDPRVMLLFRSLRMAAVLPLIGAVLLAMIFPFGLLMALVLPFAIPTAYVFGFVPSFVTSATYYGLRQRAGAIAGCIAALLVAMGSSVAWNIWVIGGAPKIGRGYMGNDFNLFWAALSAVATLIGISFSLMRERLTSADSPADAEV